MDKILAVQSHIDVPIVISQLCSIESNVLVNSLLSFLFGVFLCIKTHGPFQGWL